MLGGALAIMGITKNDGANGASLTGIDAATQGKLQTMQLGPLGSLREFVLDTVDFKGREWNRAHHSGSAWKGMTDLVNNKGYGWDTAALVTGDSMTSWSGRVLGSNNQDGSETGFAADELAGLKYTVLMEKATGKPALESILGAHAATHLPEDKLTDPKINKLIGLPEGYRPETPEDMAMVAGKLRQWASSSDVKVNQGEFEKFVEAGNTTPEGQQLAASGLLSTVQFEPEEAKTEGGGDNGPSNAEKDAAAAVTGLGDGAAAALPPADATALAAATAPAPAPSATMATATPAALAAHAVAPADGDVAGATNADAQAQLLSTFVTMLQRQSAALTETGETDGPVSDATEGAELLPTSTTDGAEMVLAANVDTRTDVEGEGATSIDGEAPIEGEDAVEREPAVDGETEVAIDGETGEIVPVAVHDATDEVTYASSYDTAALMDSKLGVAELDGTTASQPKQGLDAVLADGTIDESERASLVSSFEQSGVSDEDAPDVEPAADEATDSADATDEDVDMTTTDPKAGSGESDVEATEETGADVQVDEVDTTETDSTDTTDETSSTDKTDKSDKTDKTDETDETDKTDKTDEADSTDATDADSGDASGAEDQETVEV